MPSSRAPAKTLSASLRALLPEVERRADETEQTRFLPQDLANKLARTGFYHMCVPKTYGGLETPPLRQLELIETLAYADGATAWCGFIGATTGALGAYLAPLAAKKIYARRTAITAGVVAPMGTAVPTTRRGVAGYIVNGRWQWGSGSRNAQWIAGGARLVVDGKPRLRANGTPEHRMMVAPAANVEILDTWHVSGLCGTGSNDFCMADLFVPHDYSAAFGFDKPLARPLYAFPQFGLLALGIAATALGLAARALAEVRAIAEGKTPQGSSRTLANRPAAQSAFAEATVERDAARAQLTHAINAAWESANRKGHLPLAHKRDLRMACTFAARRSAAIVDVAYNLAGGSAVYRRARLQRIFRDIHVLTQHVMVAPATYELTGRLWFGLPTNTDML